MSLLLDARKKAQQALSAQGGDVSHAGLELSMEDHPNKAPAVADPLQTATPADDRARIAGQNLFGAKSPSAPPARQGGINRNLLLALGGTVILLAAGAGYVWYIDTSSNDQPLRVNPRPPVNAAPVPAPSSPILAAETTLPTPAVRTKQTGEVRRKKKRRSSQSARQLPDKPQQITQPDGHLINNAYLAYRSGKLDQARQMYLEVLGKDPRNTDALLGLGAVSQQLGEDKFASQFYMRVLTLDPRNAVANAGMSTLSMDVNSESRLKTLLREQPDSAALHFALGNIYAGQSRWGEAQSAYFNAYTLDSKNAELAFNLAISLEHLGQNKLAAQHYQRALQLGLMSGDQPHGLDHVQISRRIEELSR